MAITPEIKYKSSIIVLYFWLHNEKPNIWIWWFEYLILTSGDWKPQKVISLSKKLVFNFSFWHNLTNKRKRLLPPIHMQTFTIYIKKHFIQSTWYSLLSPPVTFGHMPWTLCTMTVKLGEARSSFRGQKDEKELSKKITGRKDVDAIEIAHNQISKDSNMIIDSCVKC